MKNEIPYSNVMLLNRAFSQYGIKEIVGNQDNPEVLKYFEATGHGSLKDETAWCSAFMNWIAKESGLEISGKLTARSWLNVGEKVDNPVIGDVVVLWRESRNSWKGHVGVYVGKDDRYIYILGGNQSNQVKVSAYSKVRLLQYRRLKKKEDQVNRDVVVERQQLKEDLNLFLSAAISSVCNCYDSTEGLYPDNCDCETRKDVNDILSRLIGEHKRLINKYSL